jgi:hypothetical protein
MVHKFAMFCYDAGVWDVERDVNKLEEMFINSQKK